MKLGAAQRAERCSVLPAHVVARARLVKQMAVERQHSVNQDDSSDGSSDMPSSCQLGLVLATPRTSITVGRMSVATAGKCVML